MRRDLQDPLQKALRNQPYILYLREHPELTAEIDQKVRAILFAPKDITPDEAKAVEAQKQEEEDDLALLEEDI